MAKVKPCPECRTPVEWTSKTKRGFCSKSCLEKAATRRKVESNRKRAAEAKKGRICAECGDPLPESRRLGTQFCSVKCQRHRRHHTRKQLLRQYGLTREGYQELETKQGGLCAICRQPETSKRGSTVKYLSVDHDHETGFVRGLLCANCNNGLGRFKDDPHRLRQAADYLDYFNDRLSDVDLEGE